MTKNEFANKVATQVNGEIKEVEKANGVVLTGIMPSGDMRIKPTVYIDSMFDDGKSVEETADAVREAFEQNTQQDFDISFVTDFNAVKPMLRARLYNKATNAPVSRSAEQYGFDNLIIVPYIVLSMGENQGGIKVNSELIKQWEVSEDEVFSTALDNSRRETKLQSMAEIMAELMGMPVPMEDNVDMVVITNDAKSYGAIGVLFVREELNRLFPNGYTVLPSSVHEVIVTAQGDQGELDTMINDINDSCVNLEEQLGNRAYCFAAA